ncbi:MAG: NTP transferase domain-containing protein [Rhodothermales bacterium]|nr:NTP transferase domain-containing protein [Rhodothermales bacterium]
MTTSDAVRAGVILAAGLGSRLAEGRDDAILKPLTPVAGIPLIVRTLESLRVAGCTRAVIVLGYRAENLEAEIRDIYQGPLDIEFVYNPHFEKSNGLSVTAARDAIGGSDFVLVMADHVLGDDLMAVAADTTPPADGAALLVDYKLDTVFDMDDATKVLSRGDQIVSIGKHIQEYNCIDTGVFVCTTGLIDALDEVYAEEYDASLSEGVQVLGEKGRMLAVNIGASFWQDVDTPEMLAHAEEVLRARL